MTRKENTIGIAVGLLATALFILAQGTWSDPITATVVDSETGLPIEGVVVVADWELKGGFEGGNPVGHLAVMEAITDQAGKFHFAGWGPRFSIRGALRAEEPSLLFFKNGYSYFNFTNKASRAWHGWQANSMVDGTLVKPEKFRGTPKEYMENLNRIASNLDSVLFGIDKECNWKKTPKMIHAMDQQVPSLPEGKGHSSAPHQHLRDAEEYYQKIGCGSTKEFLKGIPASTG